MGLIHDLPTVISATAAPGQVSFTFPFKAFSINDIDVTVDDVPAIYNASPVGADHYKILFNVDEGGQVVFGAPMVGGEVILIVSDIPIERVTQFPNTGPVPMSDVNLELNRHIRIMQDLEAGIGSVTTDFEERAIKVPEGETVPDLPPAPERAQGILGFDSNGDPVIVPATDVNLDTVLAHWTKQFTATAGQTDFNTIASYVPKHLNVYVNGVRLEDGEFIALGGNTFQLVNPATDGDLVVAEAFYGGASVPAEAVAQRAEMIAAAGQTVFAGPFGYEPGYLSVFINGAKLADADFDDSSGSSITLASPATAGDIVQFEGFLGSAVPGDASSLTFTQAGAGAVTRSVQDKLREVEVSVFDFMDAGQIAAVESYAFTLDVTVPFQAAIDYAFRNALKLRAPAGGYLVTQIVYPSDLSADWRGCPFEFYGDGRGEAFVVNQALARGTIIRGTLPTAATFRIKQRGPNEGGGCINIHDIRFEGTQNAFVPVFRADTFYGASQLRDCDFYQNGPGDGVHIYFAGTGCIERCYILCGNPITGGDPAWVIPNAPGLRTGVGFWYFNSIDTGLFNMNKITSRGFEYAYKLGDGTAAHLFSCRMESCEVSASENGVWLTSSCQFCVIDSCYMEGGDYGFGVKDDGAYNRVLNTLIFPGFSCGIDARADTYGGVYSGNILSAGSVANTALLLVQSYGAYGGPGKQITGNSFVFGGSGGSIPGVVGLGITGVDPRLDLSGNTFLPRGPWIGGAGTKKIQDDSQSITNTAARGNFGFGVHINGDFEFPAVQQGSYGFGIPELPLDNAALVSGVLTTGDGSFFKVTRSGAAADFVRFPVGVQEGQLIKIWTTNNLMVFKNGVNLKLAGSVDYTPPVGGAILTFVITRNNSGFPVAVECAGRVVF